MSGTILTENLVITSAGYLKVPDKFKGKYPNWKGSNPVATLEKVNKKIHLTYIFDEDIIIKDGQK